MSGKQQVEKIEKTPFQHFIEANQNLIDCYENVKEAQGDSPKPDSSLLSKCEPYKNTIIDLLRRDQLVMSLLIKERVKILHRLGKDNLAQPCIPDLD
eukprot:403370504